MFRLFTEQKDLLQKIFNEVDLVDQISLSQVNKKANEIAKSPLSTFGNKHQLKLLAERYAQLPNHEHPDAIKIRKIFTKATDVKLSSDELAKLTPANFSGHMKGVLDGMEIGYNSKENLNSRLQQNLRRK